jgi:hypothetical protein
MKEYAWLSFFKTTDKDFLPVGNGITQIAPIRRITANSDKYHVAADLARPHAGQI